MDVFMLDVGGRWDSASDKAKNWVGVEPLFC